MLCDLKEIGKISAILFLPRDQSSIYSKDAELLPGIPPHASLRAGGGLLPIQVDVERQINGNS